MMHTSGRWLPEDRWRGPFRTFPFRVPAGIDHIRIQVTYLKTSESALDVGLRRDGEWIGWSGSELTSVDVGNSYSSPGYNIGLSPGQYSLILGLHRVPAEGLPYEISVISAHLPSDMPSVRDEVPLIQAPPDPWSKHLDAGLGRMWRRGDLHVHSIHSDGVETPLELGWRAKSVGLDYIAVTDHNTASVASELDAAAQRTGVLLLLGQELTTDSGYATVIGDASQCDFRRHPDQWLANLNDGAIFINHPTRAAGGWRAKTVGRFPAVEVWNGTAVLSAADPVFRWWSQHGFDMVAVGGSGWHGNLSGTTRLGQPTTWLAVHEQDYADAIRSGRASVSASPQGSALLRNEDHILVLGGENCRVYSLVLGAAIASGLQASVTQLETAPGPLLLLDDHDQVLAICN